MYCISMSFSLVTSSFKFQSALKNTFRLLLVFLTFSASSLCHDPVFSGDSASSQCSPVLLILPFPLFNNGGFYFCVFSWSMDLSEMMVQEGLCNCTQSSETSLWCCPSLV